MPRLSSDFQDNIRIRKCSWSVHENSFMVSFFFLTLNFTYFTFLIGIRCSILMAPIQYCASTLYLWCIHVHRHTLDNPFRLSWLSHFSLSVALHVSSSTCTAFSFLLLLSLVLCANELLCFCSCTIAPHNIAWQRHQVRHLISTFIVFCVWQGSVRSQLTSGSSRSPFALNPHKFTCSWRCFIYSESTLLWTHTLQFSAHSRAHPPESICIREAHRLLLIFLPQSRPVENFTKANK